MGFPCGFRTGSTPKSSRLVGFSMKSTIQLLGVPPYVFPRFSTNVPRFSISFSMGQAMGFIRGRSAVHQEKHPEIAVVKEFATVARLAWLEGVQLGLLPGKRGDQRMTATGFVSLLVASIMVGIRWIEFLHGLCLFFCLEAQVWVAKSQTFPHFCWWKCSFSLVSSSSTPANSSPFSWWNLPFFCWMSWFSLVKSPFLLAGGPVPTFSLALPPGGHPAGAARRSGRSGGQDVGREVARLWQIIGGIFVGGYGNFNSHGGYSNSWMMTGGSPILVNHHIIPYIYIERNGERHPMKIEMKVQLSMGDSIYTYIYMILSDVIFYDMNGIWRWFHVDDMNGDININAELGEYS